MKTARTLVGTVAILLLGGGYFASQYAYFAGDPASYIRALDSSSVPILALLLLLATVIMAIVPEREESRP